MLIKLCLRHFRRIKVLQVHVLYVLNTPLNLCSVCGGLGLACLDKIHMRHAFRGCVKSDITLDSHAVLASL